GGNIQKGVERASAEARADPKNDGGDGEPSKGIGIDQPGHVPGITGPNEPDADDDDDGAPDVSRKMQRIGFQRVTGVFFGHTRESPRSRHVNRKGNQEHKDSGQAGLDVHAAEEEAREGFVNDVEGGEGEEAGFDEGGKVFEFSMAVE